MAKRYFTPEEANARLATIGPLVERMVEQRRALSLALERREQLNALIGGNGGGLDPRAVSEVDAAIESAATGMAECMEQIEAAGAIVKDVDAGLIDFPALRRGEEVLLCWRLGEDEIRFWHTLDGGFAGRQPLPL